MELRAALERVSNRQSFLDFARLLAKDRADKAAIESFSVSALYGSGTKGWENWTIEAFLDSAISWAQSTDFGLAQGLPPENPWKQFAAFLYCGKTCE